MTPLAGQCRDAITAVYSTLARDDVALLAESPTTRQVADLLGVNPTTVARWHAKGAILGFTDSRGHARFPSWQFNTSGPLPGWAQVAPHAVRLPLTTVGAFMRQPQGELSGADPIDFLTGGGDPALVTDLIEGLRVW